jgi:transposase InsO family protein
LWLNDGSCVRLRPERKNDVRSYDFVSAKTQDGRTARILNLIDEQTRECLMIRCERSWSSARVISALADVMMISGVPEHLHSDNGPEFVARDLRKWLAATGAQTLYIEPGAPWENGYCESFNSKLRDEFLNGEIFYSMKELRALAERWRVHYNTVRPHCLGRPYLLAFRCLYQRKQPPNLPVCDQYASAPMNRNTLGLIVVGSGILFVVARRIDSPYLLLSKGSLPH